MNYLKLSCFHTFPDIINTLYSLRIIKDETYIEYQRYKISRYISLTFKNITIKNIDCIDKVFSLVFDEGTVRYILIDGRSTSPYILIYIIEKYWIYNMNIVLILYDYLKYINYELINKQIKSINDMYNKLHSTSILEIINLSDYNEIPFIHNNIIRLGDYYNGPICGVFDIICNTSYKPDRVVGAT